MKNMKELTEVSVVAFYALRNKEINVAESNSLGGHVANIIKGTKLKLEYNKANGDHSKIEFLDY